MTVANTCSRPMEVSSMAARLTPGCPAMESNTQVVRSVDCGGRYMSAGPVSVAWRSETGPREQNQDSARRRLLADGSWLVAVADGLGGHPRGRAAARSAIRALPRRISGPDEMHTAFKTAHKAVTKLTPGYLRYTMREIRGCPATTLSLNPPIGLWRAWVSRVGGGLGWCGVVGGVVWCVWACWGRGVGVVWACRRWVCVGASVPGCAV